MNEITRTDLKVSREYDPSYADSLLDISVALEEMNLSYEEACRKLSDLKEQVDEKKKKN